MAGALASVRGATAAPGVPKVAYHLSDLDKVVFVLGNIANHHRGMGGSGKVGIAPVVHGPALKAFKASRVEGTVSAKTGALSKEGLNANACVNT